MSVFLLVVALVGLIATVFTWRRADFRSAMMVAVIFIAWGGFTEIVYTGATLFSQSRTARREAVDEHRANRAARTDDRGFDQPHAVIPDTGQH